LGETLLKGQKHSCSWSNRGKRATLRVSLVSSVLFLGEFSHSGDKRHHVRVVKGFNIFSFVFSKLATLSL
jgi:hypothetical protein